MKSMEIKFKLRKYMGLNKGLNHIEARRFETAVQSIPIYDISLQCDTACCVPKRVQCTVQSESEQ